MPSAIETSIVSLWTSSPTNMLRFPMTYLLVRGAVCEASDTPHHPRCTGTVGLCFPGAISARWPASAAAEQAPLKSRARAGGRRLSAHAEAVTAIVSRNEDVQAAE